jgi:pyruvate dehydrogenase E1 component alpha subunit
MGTSTARSSSNTEYYKRGDLIPGLLVNGQDVFHMHKVMEFCKAYALEHGPIFVEAKTYRYHGHSMSDPGLSYRSREEVQ